MEKLIKVIDKGWDIEIYNQVKRMDDSFDIRVCWKAQNNDIKIESEWEGFENSEDAINDLIEKCKANTTYNKPKKKRTLTPNIDLTKYYPDKNLVDAFLNTLTSE